MSNWKLINTTILYDGTFHGFLTIVFDCFRTKTLPIKIFSEDLYINNFLDKVYHINTNEEKAQRVFNGIYKQIGYISLFYSFYAFLSNYKNKETDILKYLCNGFEIGSKINHKLTLPYVSKVISMHKYALGECHRLKGLLRFIETDTNVFYSTIHPDNNILEPLGHHFMNRLPLQDFIIHDKNRELCFLYHNNNYNIVDGRDFITPNASNAEKQYQSLWKLFFNTISIDERKNSKCQMQFMPKKYWKDLIEKCPIV